MLVVLIAIYIAFISLGLPESLIGTAWASYARANLGKIAQGFASIYTFICSSGTAVTSFFTGKLIRKFGTGWVTFISVLLTAIGLVGISFAPSLWAMIPFSIIMGIGAGAVDSGLNNFVSLHYKPWHMSWLHCFWGVGVTISPLIMAYFLKDSNWRGGYSTVGIIQFCIVAIILFSLPLWKKIEKKNTVENLDVAVKATYNIGDTSSIALDNLDKNVVEKTKDLSVISILKSKAYFAMLRLAVLRCEFTLRAVGAAI